MIRHQIWDTIPTIPYFQTNACLVLSSGAFLLSVFVAVTNIILLLLQLVWHAVLVWSYVSSGLNWSESGGTEPHLFAQAYYGIRSGWLRGGKARLLIQHNDFPYHGSRRVSQDLRTEQAECLVGQQLCGATDFRQSLRNRHRARALVRVWSQRLEVSVKSARVKVANCPRPVLHATRYVWW